MGFTDLPSRLPTQSSTLYSNNISKFLLSIGPFTTKTKDAFQIDHKDDAARGALVLEQGESRWPAPPPAVRSWPLLPSLILPLVKSGIFGSQANAMELTFVRYLLRAARQVEMGDG